MTDKTKKTLVEKWEKVLDKNVLNNHTPEQHKTFTTAQLLENTESEYLKEASNTTGGVANFDPVLIGMVRRMAPKLIAYDVMGVQAMNMPTGLIFALKARYAGALGVTPAAIPANSTPQGGAEAQGLDEPRASYTGTGTDTGTDPFAAGYGRGEGMDKATGETAPWAAMGVTIEKTSVEAKTRNVRADYTIELSQDMQSVHGLDADNELVNILSTEVLAELNREIVGTIYKSAKIGAQFAGTAGTYDLQNDSDGRWAAERYRGLMFAIERDANAIAVETRRGKGNVLIVSSDVASALAMAGMLSYAPAIEKLTGNLEVDVTGTTYAGQAGRFKVFVDPYATGNGYVVGFKGANQYDAGIFYCPYTPLQLVRAVDPATFAPALGFKSRYGIVANPFTTMANNTYYRKARITNLI